MEPGSYSFLISNLDAFGMIYTQLSALITSQAGYLACGLRSYRIRETEAWRRRGLPWGPPVLQAASEPTPPALDRGGVGVGNTPREVWKGRAWPEASGYSSPGCVAFSLRRSLS